MSTQQIPTVAQLAAARKILWHQGLPPVSPSFVEETPGGGAAGDGTELIDGINGISASAGVLEAEPEAADAADEEGTPAEDGSLGDDDAVGDDGAEDEFENDGAANADGFEDDGGEEFVNEDGGEEPAESAAEEEAPGSAAVVTMEAARALIERAGLMAFVPHAALSATPAPSFVEATLGEAKATITPAEMTVARSLLARLVAEGSVVPLNLLGTQGTTGETPDFVVSAAAFPYVFTLRGDKGWKQLPETTGANKVSPLAVNAYSLLVEQGPKTAYALAGDLGKGLTEAAVLRGLSDLWQQLRVIPVPQRDGKGTVWEPVTTRLTRQIKAGANAGQPTALSALISLYLGQALLATEDEIEVFLSTVAPRSRVRDVVHALMAAGELESITVAGKQSLYVAGELPEFGEVGSAAAPRAERGEGPTLAEDGPRMRRMVKSTRPTGERARPFAADRSGRPGGAGRGGFAARPGTGRPSFDRGAGSAERPQRGFGDRPGFGSGAARGPGGAESGSPERSPRFDRPWEENKRPPRPGGFGGGDRGRGDRPRPAGGGFRAKEEGAAGGRGFRPQVGAGRSFGGDRPAFGRGREGAGDAAGERSGPRPPFAPRGEFKPRPPFKPRGERPFGAGEGRGEDRGPRPSAGARGFGGPPRGDRAGAGFSGDRERRPFRREGAEGGAPRGPRREGAGPSGGGPRSGEDRGGGRPPFRRFDAPREGGRPFRPEGRGEGGEGSRGAGARAGRDERPAGREFGPRAGGDRPAGRGFGPRAGAGEGGARPFRPAGGGGGARFGAAGRSGGDAGKRPFAGRGGAGPRGGAPGAAPFDKFKDGNKPWGKRPPARKIKPEGEEG